MKRLILSFMAGIAVMAGGGYLWLHRDADELAPTDEPKSDIDRGIFRTSKTIAVGEVVNGVRRLNRLVVFQSYLTANTTTHEEGWVTSSSQTMLTPAFVNYYVDMRTLNAAKITVRGTDVFVSRPAIIVERPNIDTRNIQIFNDGVWTSLTSTSDRMRAKNNTMALKQLVSRAKMPFLVDAATRGAEEAIANNVRAVLVSQGHPEAIVHVAGAK